MAGSGAWITRLDDGRSGPRVAVKDLIDVAGVPTTAGCRAVAAGARPADRDAGCLAGLRLAIADGRARLVGKTNLHELAAGVTGVNPWFGTPRNPLDHRAVPGGSSSGSAVAVGAGEADIAFGTDTGGSVRIPAACCGVVGLKTTHGRIALDGVWPLAPSLDTVGPLGRDVDAVIAGMALLEPGFATSLVAEGEPGGHREWPVARVRLDHLGIEADPAVDAVVDAALATAGLARAPDVRPDGWVRAERAAGVVLGVEARTAHHRLVDAHRDSVGADVVAVFDHAARHGHQRVRDARSDLVRWCLEMEALLADAGRGPVALALPTIGVLAPQIGPDAASRIGIRWTLPVNAAGLPALAVPLAVPGTGLRASIQLVGAPGSEARLCRLGKVIEQVAG